MFTNRLRRLYVFVAIVAVLTATGLGSAHADTTLLFGGTDNPHATNMQFALNSTVVAPNSTAVHVWTPEEFAPASGAMTYNQSRTVGQQIFASQMDATPGSKRVVAYSQSASFVSDEIDRMNRAGTLDHDQVDLVLIANPRTPRSGIETKLGDLSMLGITPMGPTVDSGVTTIAPCRQYDPICDFPEQLNMVTAANALAGYRLLHPHYTELDTSQARHRQVGNTDYVTIPTDTPPIVQVVRDVGIAVSADDEAIVKSIVKQSDPGPSATLYAPPVAPQYLASPAPVVPVVAAAPQAQVASESINNAAVAVKQAIPPDMAPAVDQFVASVQSSPIVDFLNGSPPMHF